MSDEKPAADQKARAIIEDLRATKMSKVLDGSYGGLSLPRHRQYHEQYFDLSEKIGKAR